MSIARSKNRALACRASIRKRLFSLRRWKRMARTLQCDESGQDLVEYALVVGLIGLGCIASMQSFSSNLAVFFNRVGRTLINST